MGSTVSIFWLVPKTSKAGLMIGVRFIGLVRFSGWVLPYGYESLHKDNRTKSVNVCVCGGGERERDSQIQNHFQSLFLGHNNHRQEAYSAGGSLKKSHFASY